MGLGTVKKSEGIYLAMAGGYIWDKSKGEDDPNFKVQEYDKLDGEKGSRQGAQYDSLSGKITKVAIQEHDEYGQSIKVFIKDKDGDKFILSVGTNNRYSQDIMKGLLKIDLDKNVFLKPYDFIGKDKKRAQGCSVFQDGKKIALRNDDAPSKDGEWFKTAGKKQIRRFFEDLSDWFVDQIKADIIPALESISSSESEEEVEAPREEAPKEEAPKKEVKSEEAKPVTIIAKRKAIRAYIKDNYEDEEMPKLSKEDVSKWYELVLAEKELPFEPEESEDSVEAGELDSQLDALMDD